MVRKAGSEGREASRSEVTRERLLEAGLSLFGKQGFDSVSTRSLAEAADANQAAIPYHFQSKEGLYHAVARRVVTLIRADMEPVVEAVLERHRGGVSDLALAREDVVTLILSLLRRILSHSHRCDISAFIVREQMHPTAAMDILYEGLLQPLHQALATLVGPLRGKAEDDPDIIIEVLALFGEAIVFGVHRTTLRRRLGVTELDADHLQRVNEVLRGMVMRQFPL
ncbi:MAG: CerR family C-terminal domain-containing protein [Alcanivorax sp.]|nr:CerR family C-terminal domain-containing protein [Alcanivorax sp.]